MKHSSIRSALFAAALLLFASVSLAVEDKPANSAETKATGSTKATTGKNAKAKDAKASAKVKLVDINGASKKELKTLPGISDTDAVTSPRPIS